MKKAPNSFQVWATPVVGQVPEEPIPDDVELRTLVVESNNARVYLYETGYTLTPRHAGDGPIAVGVPIGQSKMSKPLVEMERKASKQTGVPCVLRKPN